MTPGAVTLMSATIFLVACGHTDPAIQAEVDSRLMSDPITAPLSVDIAVSRGVVRLEGEVESVEQRRRALALTGAVPGVKDVIDALSADDETVAAAVRQALASDPLVGRIPITVSVRQGHVQLISDQTGKEDRARAMEVVTRVAGVKAVDDLMR
jgi:osmotically-inducible protein OsmY